MKIIAFVKRTLVMAVMFFIASNNASLWAGDINDYNGDGKADLAVYASGK